MRVAAAALGVTFWACAASGQATSPGLVLKAVAEVETAVIHDGHRLTRLTPADRVVPGDAVVYTLEIRNTGPAAVHAPVVTFAIPMHMSYVADSAAGPGARVTYSLDGGLHFESPELLRVPDSHGRLRPARPDEYTHIRWNLKNTLKANSVAFARFRAVVK